MKYLRLLIATMAIVIASMFLFSCSSDNNSVGNTANEGISEYVIYDYETDVFEMQDATFDKDIFIDDISEDRLEGDRLTDRKMPRHVRGHHLLGRALMSLDLSEEQIVEIRAYVSEHHACQREWLKKLHESRIEIIRNSNQERQDILAQLRNGDITRREAENFLFQLNLRTRKALRENELNAEVRTGLIECRTELFSKIASALTEEQLVKWLEFVDRITG